MDRLYGEYDYTFEDIQRTKGMVFVQKYLRMKHVIVFKMSHDALQVCSIRVRKNFSTVADLRLQFNFYDHSKVIISSHGLRVTHIDKNYQLTRWKLTEIMAASLRAPSSDPETAKFQQRLLDKVKYCRDVLLSIKNASDNPPPAVEKAVPVTKEASRSSRNALR
jgi:cell cycle serine/threonine-protein kinase CDC5/MSD2